MHRARIWFQRPKARLDYLSELARMVNSFLAGMTVARTNYGYLKCLNGSAYGTHISPLIGFYLGPGSMHRPCCRSQYSATPSEPTVRDKTCLLWSGLHGLETYFGVNVQEKAPASRRERR